MKKIHVLEVLGNAIVGGMENYVRNLIRCLPDEGFRVSCLCPYESIVTTELREMGVDVYVGHMEDDPPWSTIQMGVEVVRGQNVDLIHAHLPRAHALSGLLGKIAGVPVVATIHGMAINSQELGIHRTVESHLITVCHRAFMQARALGVPEEKVNLIYNGVDAEGFRPLPREEGTALRTELGIPVDAPVVGFVGRLAWEKGPDLFLQVAERVRSHHPETHFVLIGTGEMEDELARKIEYMGAMEQIHLAGLLTNMSEVYPAFDVLAQTSRVEGTPLVLLEAMASGLPIVAMGVGGVIEMVEVGTTGFLAGHGDVVGVAEGLRRLLSNPGQRTQMGRAARARVEERFSLKKTVEQTSTLLQLLVQPAGGRDGGVAGTNGLRPGENENGMFPNGEEQVDVESRG